MTKLYRAILIPLSLLCMIMFFVMAIASSDYVRDTPSYRGEVFTVKNASATVNGEAQSVSLPHSFKNLSPRTPVTITADLNIEKDCTLYVKSVYAPLAVYVDDRLVYRCGQEGSVPSFMADPATTVAMIPLDGIEGEALLRMEFLSPVSRSTLAVHPPLLGGTAPLFRQLLITMGLPFTISLLEIAMGVMLMIIVVLMLPVEHRSLSFLWLGVFSFVAGMWAFGECNLTGLFISNPTVLYLMAFSGMILIPPPLLMFATTIVDYRDKRPLYALLGINLSAAAVLFLLQMTGLVPFSKSLFVFHALIPLSLLFLTAYTLRERLQSKSVAASRFLLPISALSCFAVFELLNYQFHFISAMGVVFQLGVMLFDILMGSLCGLFIRDAILAGREKRALEFELQLLGHDIEEQKKHQQLLLSNADMVRRQRHDLRHQLAVIRSMGGNSETDKRNEYIDSLIQQIPNETAAVYCDNIAVNAIVCYYAEQAKKQGIELTIDLTVPAKTDHVPDSSLCVIFGNLFENAIEACARMTEGRRFITLKSRMQYEILTVTMDNSFDGVVSRDSGGLISSKRASHGIGTASVSSVAKQNSGGADFEADGKVFMSSVYLKI